MMSTCGSGALPGSTRISDEDIEYALRHAIPRVPHAEDNFVMRIGPAPDGRHLEIGVLDIDGDDPVVIHAMELRRKFYGFL